MENSPCRSMLLFLAVTKQLSAAKEFLPARERPFDPRPPAEVGENHRQSRWKIPILTATSNQQMGHFP